MNPVSGVNSQQEVPTAAARRDAWTRYWSRGAAHSCPGTYGDRYGGAIAAFWRGVFAGLPNGARVLDVATGNGALPRLLLDHCAAADVVCEAVDIAEVRPAWLAAGDAGRVRFHGGVDAARVPFPDAVFDLIVSQYGFEYTDVERSLAEVLRVRAPTGGIAMVLHHAQGRPATLATVEIGHLRWLSGEGGLFEAAEALVEPMARAATPEGRATLQRDAGANAAREHFNAIQGELSARAGADGGDVLGEVRDAVASIFAMAGRRGALEAGNALAALRQEYEAAQTRLQDLCDHALDVDDMQSLQSRIAAALGVPVELGELREAGDYVMGWTLRA